uniref:Uncharacterized protein n=1 Tax=Anguilla anguilla TaxID=7936 RepID=A0A0E9SRW6_ANGAN
MPLLEVLTHLGPNTNVFYISLCDQEIRIFESVQHINMHFESHFDHKYDQLSLTSFHLVIVTD